MTLAKETKFNEINNVPSLIKYLFFLKKKNQCTHKNDKNIDLLSHAYLILHHIFLNNGLIKRKINSSLTLISQSIFNYLLTIERHTY